jgi:hypothetical protein
VSSYGRAVILSRLPIAVSSEHPLLPAQDCEDALENSRRRASSWLAAAVAILMIVTASFFRIRNRTRARSQPNHAAGQGSRCREAEKIRPWPDWAVAVELRHRWKRISRIQTIGELDRERLPSQPWLPISRGRTGHLLFLIQHVPAPSPMPFTLIVNRRFATTGHDEAPRCVRTGARLPESETGGSI